MHQLSHCEQPRLCESTCGLQPAVQCLWLKVQLRSLLVTVLGSVSARFCCVLHQSFSRYKSILSLSLSCRSVSLPVFCVSGLPAVCGWTVVHVLWVSLMWNRFQHKVLLTSCRPRLTLHDSESHVFYVFTCTSDSVSAPYSDYRHILNMIFV